MHRSNLPFANSRESRKRTISPQVPGDLFIRFLFRQLVARVNFKAGTILITPLLHTYKGDTRVRNEHEEDERGSDRYQLV